MTSTTLFIAAGLFTAVAALLIWRDATQSRDQKNRNTASSVVMLVFAAIIANIWAIHTIESVSAQGINFTLASGVAVSTLIVQAIYLFGVMRHGIKGLGLLVLPTTALPLFLVPILPEAHTPNWVHTTSLLETGHLLISLIAYAVLTLAAVHAVMQIVLDRALKRKRVTRMMQALPSLVEIERHMISQVKIATVLLAGSILTGLSWQWVDYNQFALLNHKVLLAIFTFGILILLLVKRHRASWPTRIASRTVLAAYVLMMLAYFGVKLIMSWLH